MLLVKFYLRLRECFVLTDHYVCCGLSVTVLCQTKIVKDSAYVHRFCSASDASAK